MKKILKIYPFDLRNTSFEIHSTDSSQIWIDNFKKKLSKYDEIKKVYSY